MSLTKDQVLLEYVKCMKDTSYALKTYLQTYDNTVSKYVPLELFPDQITLLQDYEDEEPPVQSNDDDEDMSDFDDLDMDDWD